ncbi:MAG TPA: hypothetical protein DCY94_02225 [Firmicutes bacterium]|nr:hypothetical protein [Bacillota bacterium]
MFYFKQKELTKEFNFSKVFKRDDLPGYIRHYILADERILVAYKTIRDHGVFTDSKIVLFDSEKSISRKEIYSIPYNSISTISVIFDEFNAEFHILLNNGIPINLKFTSLDPEDKTRIRILYTAINRIISGQKPDEKEIENLMNDKIELTYKNAN